MEGILLWQIYIYIYDSYFTPFYNLRDLFSFILNRIVLGVWVVLYFEHKSVLGRIKITNQSKYMDFNQSDWLLQNIFNNEMLFLLSQ